MKIQRLKMNALAAGLLLASVQVQAYETRGFHPGFYVGGALGASWGHTSWGGTSSLVAINDQGVPLTVIDEWTPEGVSSLSEIVGRIFVGYEFVHQPLYLAIEFGGTLASAYEFELNQNREYLTMLNVPANTPPPLPAYTKTLDASALLNDKVTLGSNELNLDLKPGWLFLDNKLLAYARVGLAVNTLSIQSIGTWSNTSTSYLDFQPPLTLTASQRSNESSTIPALRLGLGAEYLVWENLGLSLDYTYTDYGYINTLAQASESSFGPHLIDPTLSPYYSVSGVDAPQVRVSTQVVMLGLLYHW